MIYYIWVMNMASRYKFSEKEIEGIEQARKENKDKRAECRLKALEMRAKGAISKEVSVATGFHAAYAQHYNIVYTDALPVFQNIHVFLESIYSRFNIDRPEDFKGHSLSVSDIVAIRQAGVVSCYYCDSIGFQKLFPHLWEIQETAERRLNQMMEELLAQNPAPDKATDPMAWVQHMNSLKAQAEETIFEEPPIEGEQVSFFASEYEQIQTIDEAESAQKAPSAFSMPQDIIDG